MKYKYYSLFIFLIVLSWIVIACSNNIDYTYKGRNYIQMSTSDDPALSESDERAITVDVLLATSVENDAVINSNCWIMQMIFCAWKMGQYK